MAVKIWDVQAQAFRDAETPKIWDSSNNAWRDSTGLVWDATAGAWKEAWSLVSPMGIKDGTIISGDFEEYSNKASGSIASASTTKNTTDITVALVGNGQICYEYFLKLTGREIKKHSSLVINATVSSRLDDNSRSQILIGLSTHNYIWQGYTTIEGAGYLYTHSRSLAPLDGEMKNKSINTVFDLRNIDFEDDRIYLLKVGADHGNYYNCEITVNVIDMYLA